MDHFRIRPATKDDARQLFEWRNDEATRRMSKNKDIVGWDEHLGWLDRRLNTDQPNLFIFELEGRPVATFRIVKPLVSPFANRETRNFPSGDHDGIA